MSQVQPDCYHRCGRKAAVGRLFCSARCGAEWAEAMARGNEDEWCVACQEWRTRALSDKATLACRHVAAGLVEGAKHADASVKYDQAIQAKANAMATQFEEPPGHLCISVGHGIDSDPLAHESRR